MQSEQILPWKLIRPIKPELAWKPDIDPCDVVVGASAATVRDRLSTLSGRDAALDVETKGTQTWNPEHCVVGVGLVWAASDGSHHAAYFDYQSMTLQGKRELWYRIFRARSLTAHNQLYDSGWCDEEQRRLMAGEGPTRGSASRRASELTLYVLPWKYCTYGLLRQLAGEDYPGQEWGLKAAMVNLLRWPDANELHRDKWLVDHGWVKGIEPRRDEPLSSFVERAWGKIIEQQAVLDRGEKPKSHVRADPAEMWRVPPGILGGYCLLDCFGTFQLLDLMRPLLERFPELDSFHQEIFLHENRLLRESTRTGIRVDVPALQAHGDALRAQMRDAEVSLRAEGSPFRERIAELERQWLADFKGKEPARYIKSTLGKEPARTTKGGKESKAWASWFAKSQRPQVIAKPWIAWQERVAKAEKGEVPNLLWTCSHPAITDLLYGDPSYRRSIEAGELGNEGWCGLLWWEPGEAWESKGRPGTVWISNKRGERVEVERTDSGGLPSDGDVLGQLSEEMAKPLMSFLDAQKELGYVEAWLENAAVDGRLHAGWISPGTSTLRLAGKDPNLSQAPKSLGILDCLIPDDDCVWIQGDAESLEPHVAAELTRDPALLELYSEGARPHDLYLFNASHFSGLKETVAPLYPVGDAVTKEAVAAAKKALKPQRSISKVITLACGYGAGAKKIFRSLRLQGADVTQEQAIELVNSYRELYHQSGKGFQQLLRREWEANGGWIYDGLGMPVAVADEQAKKDLPNRVIQRTGHLLLMILLKFLTDALQEAEIPCQGIVWDFHDELIYQVRRSDAERAIEVTEQAVRELNAFIDAKVKIKLSPRIVEHGLGQSKMEEQWAEREVKKEAKP